MRRNQLYNSLGLTLLIVVAAVGIALFCYSLPTINAQVVNGPAVYRSGVMFGQQNESVSGSVYNADSISHNVRILVRRVTSVGTTLLADTGNVAVPASAVRAGGYLIPAGVADTYQVEIDADDPHLLPSVTIQPPCAVVPCTTPRLSLYGSQLF